MKVRELVGALRRLPDQEATVVIGEGEMPNVWLAITSIKRRAIVRTFMMKIPWCHQRGERER
jgi:hypothetical protein